MIILTELQRQLIKEHALKCYPNEMCGVLTADYFYPITNVSEDKATNFKLDMCAFIRVKDPIAIVHSHCRDIRSREIFDTRTPSKLDITQCAKSGLKWLIVTCEGHTVSKPLQLPRLQTNNYIGRPFIWFINDCYTLAQDYYKFELDITLQEHSVELDYKNLRLFNNIFDEFLGEFGFSTFPNAKDLINADLLLLDNGGFRRNHFGIFHNGKVLHQDMLSVEVPFETFLGRINCFLRHKER